MPLPRQFTIASLDLFGRERERQLHQRKGTAYLRTRAEPFARRRDPLPAFLHGQLYSPDSLVVPVDTPGLVDGSKEITLMVARECHTADVGLQPLLTNIETATQFVDLRRFDEGGFEQWLQVLIVSVHHTARGHGNQAAAQRVRSQTVDAT